MNTSNTLGTAEALKRINTAFEEKSESLYLGGLGLTEVPKEIAILAPFLKELTFSRWSDESENSDIFINENNLNSFEYINTLVVLEELYLDDTQLNNLNGIENLVYLNKLRIGKSNLHDISILNRLPNLKSLDIDETTLDNLPVFPYLEELYIDLDNIKDINNISKMSLKKIQIYSNITTNTFDCNLLATHQFLEGINVFNELELLNLEALSILPSLKNLNFHGVKINNLSFLNGMNVESLSLSNNLSKLSVQDTKIIGNLKDLKQLSISTTTIDNFSFLNHLSNLEDLSIWQNTIENYDFLKNMPLLKSVAFGMEQILDCDFLAECCPFLEHIYLSGRYSKHDTEKVKIYSIAGLKSLKNLKKLSIFHLSETLEGLKELSNLVHLTKLGLSQFDDILDIEAIASFKQLETLDLSYSNLSNIEFIEHLTQLESIHLQGNKITELPEWIGNFSNLRGLDIRQNALTSVPVSILNCKRLFKKTNYIHNYHGRGLRIKDNPFGVPEEVWTLNGRELVNYLIYWQEQRAKGKVRPVHESKVIFVGESNFGKTHLIEYLLKGKIERTIHTTHGIERNYKKFTIPNSRKRIKVNFWDLGGQQFMRSTHQFFFTERTLYVLVTLARTERKSLTHWLELIQQLSENAPVLIVVNQIDKDPHQINHEGLQREYPNIVDFVYTSIHQPETMKELEKKIVRWTTDKEKMPFVYQNYTNDWFSIKKGLEDLQCQNTDFISFEKYQTLYRKKTFNDFPDGDKTTLKILNSLGVVVSFVEDDRLKDTNVLNPQWVLDGIYGIINDKKIKDDQKGFFSTKDLRRILDKKRYPEGKHIYMIDLMHKFKLCYPIVGKRDEYLIPVLFTDVEPHVAEWNIKKVMRFRFDYGNFAPEPLMAQCTVILYQSIYNDLRWNQGAYFSNGQSVAKIFVEYKYNIINIEIGGEEALRRSYLKEIQTVFAMIHKPYDLKLKREVFYEKVWLDYDDLLFHEQMRQEMMLHRDVGHIPVIAVLDGYSTSKDRQEEIKEKMEKEYRGRNHQSIAEYKIETTSDSKKMIAFITANPDDTTRIRTDKEFDIISSILDDHQTFTIKPHFASDVNTLLKVVLKQPYILHIAAHGTDLGELIFEDKSGFAAVPSLDNFGELLGIMQNIKCVFLNACYTEKLAKSIREFQKVSGARIIGTTKAIEDEGLAIPFAEWFYRALSEGQTIENAFTFAKLALKIKGKELDDDFILL